MIKVRTEGVFILPDICEEALRLLKDVFLKFLNPHPQNKKKWENICHIESYKGVRAELRLGYGDRWLLENRN